MGENEKLNLFGVTEEELAKSKDILPTFDLGKIDKESKVVLKFLESEPKYIKHKNNFKDKDSDPDEIETPAIKVFVDTIFRPDEDEGKFIEIPMQEEYTLWLSSKSLSMGIAKVFQDSNNNLKDVVVKIHVGTAQYKKFGENRCYNVTKSEIKTEI